MIDAICCTFSSVISIVRITGRAFYGILPTCVWSRCIFLSTSSPRFILLEITNFFNFFFVFVIFSFCLWTFLNSANSSPLLVFLIALQLTHLDRKKFFFLVFFFQFSEAVLELCNIVTIFCVRI